MKWCIWPDLAALLSHISKVALISVFAVPVWSDAQPNVTLLAKAQNKYREVLFTFIQDNLPSMQGCHYNLFAADRRSKLNTLPGQGLSIATFYRELPSIQIIAAPLPQLARESIAGNPKVFFRVLLSCPDAENGSGEILALRMRTYGGGKLRSIAKLAKSMKYHMQYYEVP